MAVAAVAAMSFGAVPAQPAYGFAPSAEALAAIPPAYLRLYEAAGARYGLDWSYLAAIGEVECSHGTDPDPSCTREGSLNPAGAGGPMQFLRSTWRVWGVDADGTGHADMWDPADAIFAAARYLRASGAPANWPRAIYAYNHAWWYVREVLAWAQRYRGSVLAAAVPGARAAIDAGGDALAPADAPAAVAALIAAGNQIDRLPYPEPDVHYGSLQQLWPAYDCSGATSYVLYRAGLASADARDSTGLESFGAPGPGRWITVYANAIHAFVEVAGIELNTVHPPNTGVPGSGPRWQPGSAIGAQLAGDVGGGFTVRHPPGL